MLDFPNNPTVGETFPDPMIEGVPVWIWDGTKWRQAGAGGGGLDPSEFVLKAGDTMTGPLAIAPFTGPALIHLRKQMSGTGAGALGELGDLSRWRLLLGDGAAEAGGNSGSNLAVSRYTDDGALIDEPIYIDRATGITHFGRPLRTPGLSDPSSDLDVPNKGYIDSQIATRIPTSERATPAQIRAQQATWQAVYTTEGMRQALEFVQRDGSGAFYPDFPNWINLRMNVQGNIAFQWPANDVSWLVGRSGLWWCVNYAAANYAFDMGSVYRYTFHNMQVPTTIATGAGAWNLFGYSFYNNSRIHMTLLGSGMS